MRKIFILFVVLISTSVCAQKEQIIGSWICDFYNYYLGKYKMVHTFSQDGTYRKHMFIDEGQFTTHVGSPKGLKWKVDNDGVLCVYGQWIKPTAFVKVSIKDGEMTSNNERYLTNKRLIIEKQRKEDYTKQVNASGKLKPDIYHYYFDSYGRLNLKMDTDEEWSTYEKTDSPWTPPVKKNVNTKKK